MRRTREACESCSAPLRCRHPTRFQSGPMGTAGRFACSTKGELVKIVDLAKQMIRLSGLWETDERIECIGLRPGEKQYEESLGHAGKALPTEHPMLRVVEAGPPQNSALVAELLAWVARPPIQAPPRFAGGCIPGRRNIPRPPLPGASLRRRFRRSAAGSGEGRADGR
jgi:hypothetical protein